MAKTTFNPKAKTMRMAEPPKEGGDSEAIKANRSAYKAQGASKWKAFMPQSSELDDIGGFISSFGNALKPVIDAGTLGGGLPQTAPLNPQFGLTIQRGPARDEYTKHFRKVELPPSAEEVITITGEEDVEAMKSSITEACSFYYDYMDLYKERKANAERSLKGGQVSEAQADILRQFISKLNEAIDFTQEQIDAVNELKERTI